MLEQELRENILLFSQELIGNYRGSLKLKRFRFYTEFLNRFPLQYQREDKIVLSYYIFKRKVIEYNICSIWKLNNRKSKAFKLVLRKIKHQIHDSLIDKKLPK